MDAGRWDRRTTVDRARDDWTGGKLNPPSSVWAPEGPQMSTQLFQVWLSTAPNALARMLRGGGRSQLFIFAFLLFNPLPVYGRPTTSQAPMVPGEKGDIIPALRR